MTHDLRVQRVYDAAPSVDTRTDVTFAGTAGGRTRLTVVQTGFPAAELRDHWTDGWGGILAGLARAVAAGTP